MIHYAVLYKTRYGFAGAVETYSSMSLAESALGQRDRAHKRSDGEGLIGYIGGLPFLRAIDEAVKMEARGY
jgi:hypothetical protein